MRPEEKKSSNFLCPPRFKHTLTIVIHPKTPGYPGALNPNRAISNGNFRAASVVVQGIRNPLPSTPPASACWAEQRCAPTPHVPPPGARSLVTAPRLSPTSQDKKKQAEVALKMRRSRRRERSTRAHPALPPPARCSPHPLVRPCRCPPHTGSIPDLPAPRHPARSSPRPRKQIRVKDSASAGDQLPSPGGASSPSQEQAAAAVMWSVLAA